MRKRSTRPGHVFYAERFLWEVLLTKKWNHIFLHAPLLPCEFSEEFYVTDIEHEEAVQLPGDTAVVKFIEHAINVSSFTIGMKGHCIDEENLLYVWEPNSISFSLVVPQKTISGIESIKISLEPTHVWVKGSQD